MYHCFYLGKTMDKAIGEEHQADGNGWSGG